MSAYVLHAEDRQIVTHRPPTKLGKVLMKVCVEDKPNKCPTAEFVTIAPYFSETDWDSDIHTPSDTEKYKKDLR